MEVSFNDIERPSFFTTILTISYCFVIILLLWFPVFLTCLPLYLLGLSIWGLPPIISPWSRFIKYFIAAFTAGRSDNIPFSNRVFVFLAVFTILLKVPLYGVFWFIDELLFSKYHKVVIKEPVFFLSGPRTGSTQLAHYLEDDKTNFIAPKCVESLFPFIWYWKFAVPILNAVKIIKMHPEIEKDFSQPQKEFYKRHSMDIQRTETFEISTGLWHFTTLSYYLGADFMKWGFPFSNLIEKPIDNVFCSSFIQFYDSIMKKVIYHRGTSTQCALVKGHFLMVANELAEHYKGAKFFTIVREPLDRLRSFINFIKITSKESYIALGYPLCPTSWRVARDYVIDTQVMYYTEEQSFYEQSQDNKLVIPFSKFVNNLSGTLESVYSFCNIPIPSDVLANAVKIQSTIHNYKKRKASYDPKFNRTLSSLGVDEDKLRDHLADYYQWMKKFEET